MRARMDTQTVATKEHNSRGVIELSPKDGLLLLGTMFLQHFANIKVSSNKTSKYANF